MFYDCSMSAEPGPASRVSLEEQARLALRCGPGSAPGCTVWLGKGRVRFRRDRWVPRRLLYALQGPDQAAALVGKTLQPACGAADCVTPGHQRVEARAPPPSKKGKRKRTVDVDMAQRMAAVRAELFKLQATLARIDAVADALPAELRGTEAQLDAEQAALRDPNAPPDAPLPVDVVWVDGGGDDDDAAAAAAAITKRVRAIEADPFGFVMGRVP